MQHVVSLISKCVEKEGAPRRITTETDQFWSHKQEPYFNVSESWQWWQLQGCLLVLKSHRTHTLWSSEKNYWRLGAIHPANRSLWGHLRYASTILLTRTRWKWWFSELCISKQRHWCQLNGMRFHNTFESKNVADVFFWLCKNSFSTPKSL